MKKTIVYLIRHSEQLRLDGIKNIKEEQQISNEKIILSVEGEIKASNLSKIDELQDIDVIWSSNYVRAISTAKYIAYENNLSINLDTNFNERKLGNLETLDKIYYPKKYSFTEAQLLDINLKTINGENRHEVNKRMTCSLNKILKDYLGKKIVIVSHGAAIKFLLMNWCTLNESRKLVYNNYIIDLNSPSIIKLEFNKDKLENLSIINF